MYIILHHSSIFIQHYDLQRIAKIYKDRKHCLPTKPVNCIRQNVCMEYPGIPIANIVSKFDSRRARRAFWRPSLKNPRSKRQKPSQLLSKSIANEGKSHRFGVLASSRKSFMPVNTIVELTFETI